MNEAERRRQFPNVYAAQDAIKSALDASMTPEEAARVWSLFGEWAARLSDSLASVLCPKCQVAVAVMGRSVTEGEKEEVPKS